MPLRKILAGALAAGLLGAVAACGGGAPSDGKVTIRFAWWGSEQRAKITNEAVQLFMRKNPNIKVTTSTAIYDAFFQKLATETAGGNAPDVMQMSDRHLREYAERDAVLDMRPHVGKEIKTADLKQEVMGLGTLEDKLYGLPLGQTAMVMVYNPVLWEKAGAEKPELGWTWDDYFEAAKKVSDETGGKVFGASDFGGVESWFKVWLSQQGKGLYTADGALGYTEQDVVTWWEMATKFRKAGAATPGEITAVNPAGSPVLRKVSASEFMPDSTVAPNAWEVYDNDYALAPPPQVGAESGIYGEPPMLISVSARTKQRAAALKLTDFIVNDPDAAKILGMSRGLPANMKNRAAIAPSLTGAWKQVYDYEELIADKIKVGPPAPPKGAGTLFTLFDKYYQDVMYDKAAPADAAKRYYAEARQVVAG
ncbi:extracellular solute-binding protein [Sphaerisporangium sp. TRM90804]|uniref:ABC transporter substrate-binding protein n=1 Tax=Sphaerisporangium sp. TRM90804 TaxID=3031113 RepID=UPI002449282D|nr:extracellular solute-binding protein [Sphaerisporangium sp. TRM90804]MDH2424345.1 extracellular solute-binding protein [Sphaerisporangium sp. TRM90804]